MKHQDRQNNLHDLEALKAGKPASFMEYKHKKFISTLTDNELNFSIAGLKKTLFDQAQKAGVEYVKYFEDMEIETENQPRPTSKEIAENDKKMLIGYEPDTYYQVVCLRTADNAANLRYFEAKAKKKGFKKIQYYFERTGKTELLIF